jgi:hypothetical protein
VLRETDNSSRKTFIAWSVLVVVVVAYPLGVLAGGLPRFPSVSDCARRATADGNLEIVFGHFSSYEEADRARDEALRYGFKGTGIAHDGCLRLKVALPGVPTVEVGREVIEEAHSVGLEPTLEHSS